ncbi:hypothetical protein IPA_02435 [Ignicoccus pacificus DSM 13166]|uniref:Uncharacterized protein n=1 Tax=Ignicoccus pacificus DSM 13166 TaxID=940294 RepID=A0A977KCM3_9CREN|nr:hypothetical protein IPA_02435 [Ignicoccus pacificus DSM 13166]
MKKVIGFIASSSDEASYSLLDLFEGPFGEELKAQGIEVIDATADAPTVVDLIKEKGGEELIIVAVKRREGRKPGTYVYKPKKKEVKDNYQLAKLATATLTGYLDVEALVDGLQVFWPEGFDKITVVECEPPCRDLVEKIRELTRQA